ncbi:MAG: deoxyribonuclease IV [Proteobacteria bacterium]|nr:deoxyribonuclease IV [Pseudomonadota bacterium]
MKNNGIIKVSLLLGAHFSIAKGLHAALYEAQAYGCNALQIFTKNANSWKERSLTTNDIEQFELAREKTGIMSIASHTSYLINLAGGDAKKHEMSCHALKQELVRSSMLGIPFVVLHPGSHMGYGESEGVRRIAESINKILAQVSDLKALLLLETTAGQGSSIGHTFEQLASIVDKIENKAAMGFCLDTSHIFAAGYDIRTRSAYQKTIRAFDAVAGTERLYLIHLNDSKKDLGSRVDRHEHIGQGSIGLQAFEWFMNDPRFTDIPKIIETPKASEGKDYDHVNLNTLRGLLYAKSNKS